MAFPKPRVVVSRCLGFFACRYNGQMLHDDLVERLRPHVSFVDVCPEADIGLGIPRFPLRLVREKGRDRLIQPETGKDATESMAGFSSSFLGALEGIDGFILKNRSPSCGMGDVRIYNSASSDAGVAQKGAGMFGRAAQSAFNHLAIEDEGRLKNYRIREHFLSKLFALAALRSVRRMGALVEFHSSNKFLILAYGQRQLNALGNIAANRGEGDEEGLINSYRRSFGTALAKPPGRAAMSNALMHMAGFFSKSLSGAEKRFFSETLALYKEGRIPYSSALSVLRAWAIRDGNAYLLRQSIFAPYPAALADLSDAGRPLDI